MKKYFLLLILIFILITFFRLGSSSVVSALSPSDYGLKEGDLISAIFSDDPDVYIVNEHGYKRLFLNPEIFKFYTHLGGFANIKLVTPEIRDAFPTVGLFRNCEKNDQKVYGFESEDEDEGKLRWVNTSGDQAVKDDPDFFKKVFCINDKEFKWYKRGEELKSVKEVPQYYRVASTSSPQVAPAIPAIPAIPAVPASPSQPFSPAASGSAPLTPSPISQSASVSFTPTPVSTSSPQATPTFVTQPATPAIPATPAQPASSTPTPTPTLSPTPTAACTDSDGGLDYYTKGELTYTSGSILKQYDACGSATSLQEYACQSINPLFNLVVYVCPFGCSNGVCLSSTSTPTPTPTPTSTISNIDFAVTNVTVSPSSVVAGSSVAVSATFYNPSNITKSIQVTVSKGVSTVSDGSQMSVTYYLSLPPGYTTQTQNFTASYSAISSAPGSPANTYYPAASISGVGNGPIYIDPYDPNTGNNYLQATSAYTVTSAPTPTPVPASITLTYPNGGETWTAGQTYTITWNSTGSINGVLLFLANESGQVYVTNLVNVDGNPGSAQWKASSFGLAHYKILIHGCSALNCIVGNNKSTESSVANDLSDSYFDIISAPTTQSNFSRNLTLGSTGNDVKQLQTLLVNEVNYPVNLITGYFGSITQNAVKKLQEKYGVRPVSGYFGAITRETLKALISN